MFTPPRQISNPAKTLVRYQLLWMVPVRLATASLMKRFRSNDSDMIGVRGTYEMQGLLPFLPTQTSQAPGTPGIVTLAVVTLPIGCASRGSCSQTIRKPPDGPLADGSPLALVLNQ